MAIDSAITIPMAIGRLPTTLTAQAPTSPATTRKEPGSGGEGETRRTFEKMVAIRKRFATHSIRVAREKDLFQKVFLGVENEIGSAGTSGDLLGPLVAS